MRESQEGKGRKGGWAQPTNRGVFYTNEFQETPFATVLCGEAVHRAFLESNEFQISYCFCATRMGYVGENLSRPHDFSAVASLVALRVRRLLSRSRWPAGTALPRPGHRKDTNPKPQHTLLSKLRRLARRSTVPNNVLLVKRKRELLEGYMSLLPCIAPTRNPFSFCEL